MKVFKDILKYKGYSVKCILTKYDYDGSDALVLIDEKDDTPVATCTSCLAEDNITHLTAIKNYSENKGMLDFLIENEVVVDSGLFVSNGFADFPLVVINKEDFIEERL